MTLTTYLREHGKTMRVYDIDNATWVFCDPRDPLKTERVPADSVELSYDNPFGIGMAEWPLKCNR